MAVHEELQTMMELKQMASELSGVIANGLVSGLKGVVQGTKTAKEAMADMVNSIADLFLQRAAEMIAKAIEAQAFSLITGLFGGVLGGVGGAAAGAAGGGGFTNVFGTNAGVGVFDVAPLTSGMSFFAKGGYVTGPTMSMIGEGGEPEYVIPESKMRESMARYSRGARGGSVIPESGAGSTSEDGGGTAVAAPIDVRYTVERINSVDYVTADQFQAGMRQAASQGAKQGEQQTLRRLQMSGSTRKRVGM